ATRAFDSINCSERARNAAPVALKSHKSCHGVAKNVRRRWNGESWRRWRQWSPGRCRDNSTADIVRNAGTKNDSLKKGVRSQLIGGMKTCAGALACNPQPVERRATVNVAGDAAHVIVGSGRDGNRTFRGIDVRCLACAVHSRKTFGEVASDCFATVQEHAVA